MKTNSRRYRRHRNPETPEKKETPFFTRSPQKLQAKESPFFQPKLAVGQAGDKFEREADTVADQVVNKQATGGSALQRKEISSVQAKGMPEAEKEKEKPVQKKDAPDKKEEEKPAAAAPDGKKEEEKPVQKKDAPDKKEEEKPAAAAPEAKKEEEKPVQKKDAPDKKEEEKPAAAAPEAKKEEEKTVQKKEEMEKREEKGAEVPVMTKRESNSQQQTEGHAGLEQRLQQGKGGAPLSPQLAAEMSQAIGADFSGVNIHTGEEASQMNRELGAQAFTHGKDIYFNSGKYDPSSTNGKRLLAHELTHVVQQGAAPAATEKTPAAASHSAPAVQKDTSTPVPEDAVINKKSKVATFKSGDFNVVVKPDKKAKKGAKGVKPDGAVTYGNISASATPVVVKGKVVSVTIKKKLSIQTTYGAKSDPEADSAYGRGHIEKDKKEGNSSLRFHEGNHGQDFIDYVKATDFPEIVIGDPITVKEYKALLKEWKEAVNTFQKDMEAQSKTKTDDVTDPPAETTEE